MDLDRIAASTTDRPSRYLMATVAAEQTRREEERARAFAYIASIAQDPEDLALLAEALDLTDLIEGDTHAVA